MVVGPLKRAVPVVVNVLVAVVVTAPENVAWVLTARLLTLACVAVTRGVITLLAYRFDSDATGAYTVLPTLMFDATVVWPLKNAFDEVVKEP